MTLHAFSTEVSPSLVDLDSNFALVHQHRSVAEYGAVGGVDEHVKFQAAIDALPASGGTILLAPNTDYSATVTTTLSVGNKAVIWRVQNGAAPPTGLPGMTLSQRYGATYIVAIEASRNGKTWHQATGTIPIVDNEFGRAYHVEMTMPDQPATDVNRGLIAYSYLLETDHHGPLGGEIRGMKGIVRGNGGQANLRSIHALTEGYNGHTGDLTGVVGDVFHSDSADGVYAPIGRMTAFLGQVGPGSQSVYTARSRVTAYTGKQRPSYGYRCEDGSLAILPEIACFYGHGGGNGDMFRMAKSDTDTTIVGRMDNLGRMLAASYNSGRVTLADDTATSFTPASVNGVITVVTEGVTTSTGIIAFRAGASPWAEKISAGGALFDASTAALAGTTGTDTHVTVSAASDGAIYIENRSGATRTFVYNLTQRSA